VSTPGSAVADRQCAACADGTYSSSTNQAACAPFDECAAGTEQSVAATASSPPVCVACNAGEYCAGGEASRQACTGRTWDDDSNPGTACTPWAHCVTGEAIAVPGSPTNDQTCAPCASGTFSGQLDAAACAPWTTCAPGSFIRTPGTDISDHD